MFTLTSGVTTLLADILQYTGSLIPDPATHGTVRRASPQCIMNKKPSSC